MKFKDMTLTSDLFFFLHDFVTKQLIKNDCKPPCILNVNEFGGVLPESDIPQWAQVVLLTVNMELLCILHGNTVKIWKKVSKTDNNHVQNNDFSLFHSYLMTTQVYWRGHNPDTHRDIKDGVNSLD